MANRAALGLVALAMCSTSSAFVLAPTPVSIQRSRAPGVLLSARGTSRGDTALIKTCTASLCPPVRGASIMAAATTIVSCPFPSCLASCARLHLGTLQQYARYESETMFV